MATRPAIPLFVVASACVALSACARGEPPAWDAAGGSYSVAPITVPPSPSAVAFPAANGAPARRADLGDAAAAAASLAPSAAPAPAASTPPMPDTGGLPQTRDKPEPSGPAFEARAAALFRAIVDDAPDAAMPFFFPVAAYEQVKAVGNPARDWKIRLAAAYTRDIHDLHLRLGKNVDRAKFIHLDVPSDRARWVEPGEEYNKLGYHRVFGSKLRYELDGRPREIEVKSLISWRGEWFVVHLSGMK